MGRLQLHRNETDIQNETPRLRTVRNLVGARRKEERTCKKATLQSLYCFQPTPFLSLVRTPPPDPPHPLIMPRSKPASLLSFLALDLCIPSRVCGKDGETSSKASLAIQQQQQQQDALLERVKKEDAVEPARSVKSDAMNEREWVCCRATTQPRRLAW